MLQQLIVVNGYAEICYKATTRDVKLCETRPETLEMCVRVKSVRTEL